MRPVLFTPRLIAVWMTLLTARAEVVVITLLEWRSVPGIRYQVESSSDLVAWSAVGGFVDATATLTPLLVTEPAGRPYVFYRVREVGL